MNLVCVCVCGAGEGGGRGYSHVVNHRWQVSPSQRVHRRRSGLVAAAVVVTDEVVVCGVRTARFPTRGGGGPLI